MPERPVNLTTTGPPETVLDAEPRAIREALAAALLRDPADRRAAVAAVVADAPTSLAAWASLGELGRDTIERYAAYRVGYHRGLDQLRASGWRGSGYVRWSQPENRGFLGSLAGLAEQAAVIGEVAEAERCEQFLRQLDPAWDDARA